MSKSLNTVSAACGEILYSPARIHGVSVDLSPGHKEGRIVGIQDAEGAEARRRSRHEAADNVQLAPPEELQLVLLDGQRRRVHV